MISSDPIARLKIYSVGRHLEGVDNIAFGAAAVQHVPPVASAGGPYSGVEGASVAFDGSGSSNPEGGPLTFRWEWGDGTAPGEGERPSHTYIDNGSYPVTLTVSNGTLTNTASTTATIANVAPSVGAISGLPVEPVEVGTLLTANATFSDPGTADTHTGVIDWGDGTSSVGVVIEANGSGAVSSTHSYTVAGVYTVTLTVTDKDGGIGQSRSSSSWCSTRRRACDGGGWIDSPAGAYPANPQLSAKATFGFVSRYHKGATTPSGNTQFHFQAAGFRFQSTSYDWMVVAGTKVQFKGSGTIGGAGDFAFLLTAVDNAKGEPDTFRIKIWDKATGMVIYDNNMGRGDGAPATTELGGGSIVIHSGS